MQRLSGAVVIALIAVSPSVNGQVVDPVGRWVDNAALSVVFPPRNELFSFRQRLETTYRDVLGRASGASFVDIEGTIVWTQEYLRYRVNGCNHPDALTRVISQIMGNGVQPVCVDFQGSTVAFPPRDETLSFRQTLETVYRDALRRPAVQTFVDAEGDVVWTQEYLLYRVNGCSNAQATERVLAQVVVGGPQAAACGVSSGTSPASQAMLRDLPSYINFALNRNLESLPRNPGNAQQITAKIALLRSPTLVADITGGQFWFEGGQRSLNGRQIPIISMFPQAHLRGEATNAVRLLERTLPMLEGFMDVTLPGAVIRVWQGFVIGNSGGGATLHMEDQATYEARTPAGRLPYDAILVHELSHTYIGHEGLNQFIELYIFNLLQGSTQDVGSWVYTRGYQPGRASNQGSHALLDVYQLIGPAAMIASYRSVYPLRPPFGQPLAQAVKDVFINAAPPLLRSQVAEKMAMIEF